MKSSRNQKLNVCLKLFVRQVRQHVIVGYNHCDDPVGGVWAEAQIVLPYYCHMLGYCRFLSLWDTRTYWRHRHLRHAWCNLRNHTRIWWIVRRGGSKNQRPTQHVSNSCRRHWLSIYVAQSSFVAALNSIAMSLCIRYHLLSGSTTYVGQIDVVNILGIKITGIVEVAHNHKIYRLIWSIIKIHVFCTELELLHQSFA